MNTTILDQSGEDQDELIAALRRTNAILQAVIGTIPDAVYCKGLDGRYILANKTAVQMLTGTLNSSQDIVGMLDADFVDRGTAELRADSDRKVLAGQGPLRHEAEFNIDGNRRRFIMQSALCLDDEGQSIGVLGSGLDITELRSTEAALRARQDELTHATRFMLMGEMASGLAHELNQPLTAVLSYLGPLKRSLDDANLSGETEFMVGEITAEAERAAQIIRQLRTYVRRGEAHHVPANFGEIINDAIRFAAATAEENGVKIRIDIAKTLPELMIDPIQIQQVVLNLVLNAIDELKDQPEGAREIVIQAGPDDLGNIKVRFSDTGGGMSAEVIQRVFDPFFSTKEDGMGMGLSICRSIIEAHGGRLRANSVPGEGAEFMFTLPIEPLERIDG